MWNLIKAKNTDLQPKISFISEEKSDDLDLLIDKMFEIIPNYLYIPENFKDKIIIKRGYAIQHTCKDFHIIQCVYNDDIDKNCQLYEDLVLFIFNTEEYKVYKRKYKIKKIIF